MAQSSTALPQVVVRVIRALLPVLVPDNLVLSYQDSDSFLLTNCGRIYHEFPRIFRWVFHAGVFLFEWIPLLSSLRFSRFSHLPPGVKKKYVDSCACSHIIARREFFKALKGLILIVYFSDKRLWSYLGYDPEPHLIERIRLREELVGGTSKNYPSAALE